MAYDPRTYAMYRAKERRAQMLEDAVQASLLRDNTMKVCQQIQYAMTDTEYRAWWESTPDSNEEFYKAAVKKLAELRAAARVPSMSRLISCNQHTP